MKFLHRSSNQTLIIQEKHDSIFYSIKMIDNKKVQVPRRLMTFAAQLQSTNKDTPNPKTRMISIFIYLGAN